MNENAIKNFSLSRARGFFACALALALAAAVLAPLAVFGADAAALAADLASSDPKRRIAAAEGLAAAGPEALPHLLAYAEGPSRLVRAARIVAQMDSEVIPALIARLTDPVLGGRAADILFQVASPAHADRMQEILACTKNEATREVCGRVQVRVMSPAGGRHRAALEEALRTDGPMGRAYACAALGQLGAKGKAAVPALVSALKDPEALVRASAARALGMIGKKARAAAPDLELSAGDADGQVRQAAAEALGKIRG